MRKVIVAVTMLLALGCILAAPVRADEQTDRLAAAKELLVVMRTTDTTKQVLPALLSQFKTIFGAQNPKIEKDLDELTPRLQAKFISRLDELVDQMAALYAKTFTLAELRDLQAFYKSPAGAKLAAMQGQLAQAGMAIGAAWGRKVGEELQGEIKVELRKRGYQI